LNVTPLGSVPVSENVEAGGPDALTVNEDVMPTAKAVLAALVITGAWLTVSVKLWVAPVPTPVEAVNVSV
jgi:hypothetical protein